MNLKKLKILLVEDDIIEVMRFKRTVAKLGQPHELKEANNGEEALKVLNEKTFLPNIILLDLNMPKLNGFEVLEIVKSDDRLRYIPVVILTTSSNKNDEIECYNKGAAGYLVKPLKLNDYAKLIENVLEYWKSNELIN
ncbi:response regulator receiver protein [Lutibacter oricola]|uniref:Response regulator receiver protein n=1 Tax=Lutibacter oricola TaxID=762486 RepID=A0A1H3AFF3_9FLAO|nr:response regulator [Lutibacter oricola]SDX28406.1 response regulator receiver protein [Lutibacter oricola]